MDGISHDFLDAVSAAFQFFDKDKNGSIDVYGVNVALTDELPYAEMESAMKSLGYTCNRREAKQVMLRLTTTLNLTR